MDLPDPLGLLCLKCFQKLEECISKMDIGRRVDEHEAALQQRERQLMAAQDTA